MGKCRGKVNLICHTDKADSWQKSDETAKQNKAGLRKTVKQIGGKNDCSQFNKLCYNMEKCDAQNDSEITELPELRRLFNEYLVNYQDPNLACVRFDKVYFADDVYHFLELGFKSYLHIKRFKFGKTDLQKQLTSFGCREGEIAYTGRDGTTNAIKCWVKDIDNSLRETTDRYKNMFDTDVHCDNEEDDEEPWYLEKGTIYE